jgi:hypothetical protein
MLFLFILLGLLGWIAISVPVALLLARMFSLGKKESSHASIPGDVKPESLDLVWVGGNPDRFAKAG